MLIASRICISIYTSFPSFARSLSLLLMQGYRILTKETNTVLGTGLFTTNHIVLTPEYNEEVSKGSPL